MSSNSSDEPEDRKPFENFLYSPIKEPKKEPEYVLIEEDDDEPPRAPLVQRRVAAPHPPPTHHQVSANALYRQISELKKIAEQTREDQRALRSEFEKFKSADEQKFEEFRKSADEQKTVMKNAVKFMRDSVGILSESRKMINESKGQRDLLEVVKVLLAGKMGNLSNTNTNNQGPSTSIPGTPAPIPDPVIQNQTVASPSPPSVSQIPSLFSVVTEHRGSLPPAPPRLSSTFCVFCETHSHNSKDCNTFDTSRKRFQQLATVTNYCTRCLNPRDHPETHGACPAAEHNDCSFCGVQNADHHAILCPKYPVRTSRGMVKPRSEPRPHCYICNRDGHGTKECTKRSSSRAPKRLRAGAEAQNETLEHDDFCMFCGRDNHASIACRTYPTAASRRAKINQEHRCSVCLKKNDSTDPSHHPNCEKAENSCDRCSTDEYYVNHHSSLCPLNEIAPKMRGVSRSRSRGIKRPRGCHLPNSNPEE